MEDKRGILLLSGGMDSTALLAWLVEQEWTVYPIIFDYGQSHRELENEAAKKVADHYKSRGVKEPKTFKFDLSQIGGSALTDEDINVPDNMKEQKKTVVPHRNGLLATIAAAYGETIGVYDIFFTPVAEDYESYPDCRPAATKALSTFLTLSATDQPADVNVHTPFIKWWKKDIVQWGISYDVPFHLTHTCYKGVKPACGECPACRERLAAFRANGESDPLFYKTIPKVLI